MRVCKVCGKKKELKEFPTYFQRTRGKTYTKHTCKTCQYADTQRRKEAYKALWDTYLVEKFGNKCPVCGFGPYLDKAAAFDLHHINPKDKSHGFQTKFWSVSILSDKAEAIKREINKCVLLCSNCHRLTHANHAIPSGDKGD